MSEHNAANRLINEASPYLQQHAYNPVDWFPWSDEAFEKARSEDKPIFLSIGYSTCHWCHVMENESFSNEKIAKILNEHFISIKVDREQRPDIDALYMDAVTIMSGSGGWPLSVFMTADSKAFYGGTYFPPSDTLSMPGFDRVLLTIVDAWKTRRAELLESAATIEKLLAQSNLPAKTEVLSINVLHKAYTYLEENFDTQYGGFGQAPKFPQASHLSMLLRFWYRTGNRKALDMVEKTLDAMAKGGIYDHIGGGFHRYSTNRHWLIPHFEKMLCDQALLAGNYIEAYQVTGKQSYTAVAREILDYCLRDMKSDEGAFYSAEDADSEGKEGTFYAWSQKEMGSILGSQNAEIFNQCYGVTEKGNFHDNKNILHVESAMQDVADAQDILAKSRRLLLEHRAKRIRPHRDEKIITSWNALMISALSLAGAVLGESKYVTAAQKAVEFILGTLKKDGRLMRFYRNRQVIDKAFLDDYANLILALLDLYEATFDAKWLAEAENLTDEMVNLFADKKAGAFFQTGKDAEKLVVRYKPSYDGAVPSGNSVAALALLKLGRLTAENRFTDYGKKVLETFSGQLAKSPASFTAMLAALDFWFGPAQEIVIAGDRTQPDTKNMLNLAHSHFLPDAAEQIEKLNPFLRQQIPVNGKTTVYICENYTCKSPVVDINEFQNMLKKLAKI
jgi:uncharacterized protein YyaL (SSP411 family)